MVASSTDVPAFSSRSLATPLMPRALMGMRGMMMR
jgi:hypothetical protein